MNSKSSRSGLSHSLTLGAKPICESVGKPVYLNLTRLPLGLGEEHCSAWDRLGLWYLLPVSSRGGVFLTSGLHLIFSGGGGYVTQDSPMGSTVHTHGGISHSIGLISPHCGTETLSSGPSLLFHVCVTLWIPEPSSLSSFSLGNGGNPIQFLPKAVLVSDAWLTAREALAHTLLDMISVGVCLWGVSTHEQYFCWRNTV